MRYKVGFVSGYGDAMWLADPDSDHVYCERFVAMFGAQLFEPAEVWPVAQALADEFDIVAIEKVEG